MFFLTLNIVSIAKKQDANILPFINLKNLLFKDGAQRVAVWLLLVLNMNQNKICSKCKLDKNLNLFGMDNTRPDGKNLYCLECAKIRQKAYKSKIEVCSDPSIFRVCTQCYQNKSLLAFPIDRGAKQGRRPSCSECDAKRKREQYLERRLTKQDTHPVPRGCEICGCKFYPEAKKGEKEKDTPHWDHLHGAEIFRGWLCHNCNTALGQFGDNIRIIEKAVLYLKERGYSPTRPLIS